MRRAGLHKPGPFFFAERLSSRENMKISQAARHYRNSVVQLNSGRHL